MKYSKLVTSLITFCLFLFILMVYCEKKPTAPERDNLLDNKNPSTFGDPFDLQAVIADGGIKLTWTAVEISPLQGYNIYRSEKENTGFTKIISVPQNTNTHTDKTVQNGHTYWYKVTAYKQDGDESSQTNVASIYINTNPLIIINGDNQYTSKREVDLTILANEATQMWISNSSTFTDGNWENYATSKKWILPVGEGTKTVYLKVTYNDTKISNVSFDSIDPRPINPSIIISNDSTYTSTRNVVLTLNATGENLQMKLSKDSTFSNKSWETFANTINFILTTGKGIKTVYVKFKNDFEIESEIIYDTINPKPMNPSFIINNGDAYTASMEVILSLSVTGENIKMKVSEDSSFSGLDWEVFYTTKNLYLSDGEGTKTLYAKFINDFEFESIIISENIILDTTPPTAIFSSTPNSGLANETNFFFDASHSTDNFEVNLFRWDWENDGIFDTDWTKEKTITYQYTIGGGNKTVKIEVKDMAGLINFTTKQIYVNTRPMAFFTVTPMVGEAEEVFNFDASSSSDYEDNSDFLQVRWDWEGDGNYDTNYSSNKSTDHQYSTYSTKEVVLQVKDSDGITGTTSMLINKGILFEYFSETNIDTRIWNVYGNPIIKDSRLVIGNFETVSNYVTSKESFSSELNIVEAECTPYKHSTSFYYTISFTTHLGEISVSKSMFIFLIYYKDKSGNNKSVLINKDFNSGQKYNFKIHSINNTLEFFIDDTKIFSVDDYSVPYGNGKMSLSSMGCAAYYDNIKIYVKR